MKLWKYSGTFLTATGIIHTIYALFIGKDAFSEMLRNGLVNSIGENYSQGFAFWFLICGVILILLGQTLQYYIKKEQKPAPVFLGYSILLLTVIGCIIEPVSGFWLFLPQAILLFIQIKNKVVISFEFEKLVTYHQTYRILIFIYMTPRQHPHSKLIAVLLSCSNNSLASLYSSMFPVW